MLVRVSWCRVKYIINGTAHMCKCACNAFAYISLPPCIPHLPHYMRRIHKVNVKSDTQILAHAHSSTYFAMLMLSLLLLLLLLLIEFELMMSASCDPWPGPGHSLPRKSPPIPTPRHRPMPRPTSILARTHTQIVRYSSLQRKIKGFS